MIEKIEKVSPFKSHDELGLNNMTGRQWIDDRWFFELKVNNLSKETMWLLLTIRII